MSTFKLALLAAGCGAAITAGVLVILPAGAAGITGVVSAGILAGGMVASARIVAGSGRSRRQRRVWENSRADSRPHVRQPAGRHIDPP